MTGREGRSRVPKRPSPSLSLCAHATVPPLQKEGKKTFSHELDTEKRRLLISAVKKKCATVQLVKLEEIRVIASGSGFSE